MRIWIDIKNAHEPLFFKSIIKNFKRHEFFVSCREFAETVDLLRKYNIKSNVIGKRPEGNIIKRILGFYSRVIKLYIKVAKFDVSLNHMSTWAVYTSKLRFKKNITIGDNDIDHMLNKRMFKYVDFLIIPKVVSKKKLIQDNMREEGIYLFDGYKEDIYVADFEPDPKFLLHLPFKDFVTIRPESIQATYIPKGIVSIVPDLFKEFSKENINVLFLPRYKSDIYYANGFSNVYIPPKPLNGLDICYYSKAVLTGAGTFAREAACIGSPAASFFPGKELLAVDQKMIEDGRVFYSRNPQKIVEYALNSKKRDFELSRSKKVQREFFNILNEILMKIK